MQKHKYNIFPEASKEDFDLLVGDISKNGYDLDFPIIIYQGAILDGWNRWRACQQVGEKPATKEFSGSDADAINYTLRTNKRRNLTSSQWATIAVDAEEIMAAIAADVERERLRKQKEHAANQHSVPSGNLLPEGTSLPTQETSVKAAAIFNTNKQYIKDAKRLKATRPEAFKAVQSGEKTITQVKKEIKTEKREQEREKKIEALEQMKEEIGTKAFPLPSLVLADPPWQYSHCKTDNRKIENHYETAEHSDIISHKPQTADDCVLFMWATAPKLAEAIDLLLQWGFDYRTCAVWDKEKIGMGYWFRGEHELLLVGVKGNVSPPQPSDRCSSMFRETRTKHSKKPENVYEWIEKAFAEHEKLEMYCREPREGWQVWGNEV